MALPRQWAAATLHSVASLLSTLWLGGLFTYGAIALPELHRTFPIPEVAPVTRHVTGILNLIGTAALTFWLALAILQKRPMLLGLTLGAFLLQTAQLVAHAVISARMDDRTMSGFYPVHRINIWAGMAQWIIMGIILYLATNHSPTSETTPHAP